MMTNAILGIWFMMGPGDAAAGSAAGSQPPAADAVIMAPNLSRVPAASVDWDDVQRAFRSAFGRTSTARGPRRAGQGRIALARFQENDFEWTASGQLIPASPGPVERDESEFVSAGRLHPRHRSSSFDPPPEEAMDESSEPPVPPEEDAPLNTEPLEVPLPENEASPVDEESGEPPVGTMESDDEESEDESGLNEDEAGGLAEDDEPEAEEHGGEADEHRAFEDDHAGHGEEWTDSAPEPEAADRAVQDEHARETADLHEDVGNDSGPAANHGAGEPGNSPQPESPDIVGVQPGGGSNSAGQDSAEFTASDAKVKDFSDFSTLKRYPRRPENAEPETLEPPADTTGTNGAPAPAGEPVPAAAEPPSPPKQAKSPADVARAIALVNARKSNAQPATGTAPRAVRLSVDSHAVLNTEEKIDSVSVLHPQVADVVVASPRKLYVIGKELGDTQLRLETSTGMMVYRVSVEPNYQALENMIAQTAPTSDVRIGTLKGKIVLIGRVSDAETVTKIEELARVFQGGDVINHLAVSGVQQTVLRVAVAEVNKEAMRSLGINWAIGASTLSRDFFFANNVNQLNPTQFASNGLPNVLNGQLNYSVLPNVNGAATNITFGFPRAELQYFVNALRENGLARTLAEPNLIAISGQTASFLAGGEVPIPVTQGGATAGAITIEYKEFGIRLAFTPTVGGGQVIRIHVMTEVSDPVTEARQINGLPVFSFRTRRVESTIECPNGHTFAIAGLLAESINAVSSKIPGVGDLPVLGTLFSSIEYQKQNTELVVLVTPQLVEALDPDQVGPLPGADITEPDDMEFYFGQKLQGAPRDPLTRDDAPEALYEPESGEFAMKRRRGAGGRLQGPIGMSAFAHEGAAD